MKNLLTHSTCLYFLSVFSVFAQTTTTVIPVQDSRVITTGVPFLLIAGDARAAGMGDMGVATSSDAYSQQWNPSKYAFNAAKSGIAVNYTPYLSKLVNDIFLGNLTYFNRLNERSAFAASFKYFSLGEIEIITEQQAAAGDFDNLLIESPNELAFDLSYSLRLADQFSMGVSLGYLRSDLKIQSVDTDATAASSFAVGLSGYYQSEENAYDSFNGRWRAGFALQNIGPKIKYDNSQNSENFLPSTLRLGAGFDFVFDSYNTLAITAEATKLLVLTPPVYANEYQYTDTNGNGQYDEDVDNLIGYPGSPVNSGIILEGQDPNVGFVSGIFQSFGDAPGGFKEEMQEFTYALGAEYRYQDSFAIRTGYFHESEEKGARQFFTFGAGFKYNVVDVDLSYLFSASKVQSPLESTLRFSLTFNFGRDSYSEY